MKWRRGLSPATVMVIAVAATTIAVLGLGTAIDPRHLRSGMTTALADPAGMTLALAAFAAAFALRALAWTITLPGLGLGQALAAIHVALGGNHVLPLRLGEPLRVVSAVRRAGVDPADAVASTVMLRTADFLSLLVLGVVAGPAVLRAVLGDAGVVLAVLLVVGTVLSVVVLQRRRRVGSALHTPGPGVIGLTTLAWVLEAVLVWQVLRWFSIELSPAKVLVVLAAAVSAQLIAVAPGGLGTYEAAATAALVAVGVALPTAAAAALSMHLLKTLYSVLTGAVATVAPAPGLWGRTRLPRARPSRPAPIDTDGPIVLFLPAFNEGPRVAEVITRTPPLIEGRDVVVVVVDDGSHDDTASKARKAGATVLSHAGNRGLGAAVRTGLNWATGRGASAIAFCDADGEYDPAELSALVIPILAGEVDYVVGSRFRGRIHHMRPHRRLGNVLLTWWVSWTVRQPVSDGQSGYRAFSPAAAAAACIPHDYNYAQVLTIDLIGQGFIYAEVPIDYRFRRSGQSFVTLPRYLGRVVPAVWQQLNASDLAT
ncbi:MAG: lysylphosphatidylglycerol synthase domain-containing protein [Euzebya sp.]